MTEFDLLLRKAAQKVIKLHNTPTILKMPILCVQRDGIDLRLSFWKNEWRLGMQGRGTPWRPIEECDLGDRLKAALMIGELCNSYENELESTTQLYSCAMKALEGLCK